jgi:glutathione S-transferase
MLTLYHNDMSVCAAKVRTALAAKKLDWNGVHLDLRRGDAQKPEYLKLNPNAVVPTLVHHGRVITESTVICEYIDDQWPDQPLKPRGQLWSRADASLDEATRRRPAPCSGHSLFLRRLSPSMACSSGRGSREVVG